MLAPTLLAVLAVAAPAQPSSVTAVCKPVRWLTLAWAPGGHVTLTSTALDETVTVLARLDGTGGAITAPSVCRSAAPVRFRQELAWVPWIPRPDRGLGCVPSPYSMGKYVNAPPGSIRIVLTHLKKGGNRLQIVNGRDLAASASVVRTKTTVNYTPTYCR
jgi:hypothetical protein